MALKKNPTEFHYTNSTSVVNERNQLLVLTFELYTTSMAQHRTKQEKMNAQIRREQQYSLNDLKLDAPPAHLRPNGKSPSSDKMLIMSARFIWLDLLRTFIASGFVFGVLIGIWLYTLQQ